MISHQLKTLKSAIYLAMFAEKVKHKSIRLFEVPDWGFKNNNHWQLDVPKNTSQMEKIQHDKQHNSLSV
jgi:hypothetical protein